MRRLATSTALTVLAVMGTTGVASAGGPPAVSFVHKEKRVTSTLGGALSGLRSLASDDGWESEPTTAWNHRIASDLVRARLIARTAPTANPGVTRSRVQHLSTELGLLQMASTVIDDGETSAALLDQAVNGGSVQPHPATDATDTSDPGDLTDPATDPSPDDPDGSGAVGTSDLTKVSDEAATIRADVLTVIRARTVGQMRTATSNLLADEDQANTLLG
jgi:septal ring-binding cell division protein DamX